MSGVTARTPGDRSITHVNVQRLNKPFVLSEHAAWAGGRERLGSTPAIRYQRPRARPAKPGRPSCPAAAPGHDTAPSEPARADIGRVRSYRTVHSLKPVGRSLHARHEEESLVMPSVSTRTPALVSDRTLRWAKQWDRMHQHPKPTVPTSETLWQRLLSALDASLGCGTRSVCGIVGHPVDGSVVALTLVCAVVLLVAKLSDMRRVTSVSGRILPLVVLWLLLPHSRSKTSMDRFLDLDGYNASEPPPILPEAQEQPARSLGLAGTVRTHSAMWRAP